MNTILIKGAELNGLPVDILIEGNRISRISHTIDYPGAEIISGTGKAIIPGFVNCHTHAAMTLFRGCGDDMPLMRWLEDRIWPREARLTEEDVYWGAKLACLEMIKSGTTTFLDGYHHQPATVRAVEEMGLRGVLSGACFDHFNSRETADAQAYIKALHRSTSQHGERITFALAPHAIYTVSTDMLEWIGDYAADNDLLIQIHLSETEGEVAASIRRFGLSPVRYLHRLGLLSPRLIIAHALYVDEEEIRILADTGTNVVHNPASNMKLASGHAFRFVEMHRAGIRTGLGTDGCSSSNNLDMIEAMKLASLLGKAWRKDPEAITAPEILTAATATGADILRLNTGRIAEGYLADLSLVDINIPAFTPNINFTSNLVYAANGSCIDTLVCNGRILMRNKKVEGEEEIMREANRCARRLAEE
jgi:5-methylthioadenosine/S-adenosylhomocysteine deaminase